MDNNFIQHQASSFKDLIELLNYKFVSDGKDFELIELVKSQILVMGYDRHPNLKSLLAKNKGWFKNNITNEYVDILFDADNYDEVCKNFVTLYNTYIISQNDKELIGLSAYNLGIDGDKNDKIDTQNIAFIYNPELDKVVENININVSEEPIDRYNNVGEIFADKLAFDESVVDKGKGVIYFNEPFKSITLNQRGVKGIIPLPDDFAFNPKDTGKQIELSIKKYNDDSYDTTKYLSEVKDTNILTENVNIFNEFIKLRETVKSKSSSESGVNYIRSINKSNLINNNYRFYALSSIKDGSDSYINTAVNLIFNKEQTISAVVDGYDFYYAVMMLCLVDSDISFDIYFDKDNDRIVLIGNKTQSVKIPVGFNQTTMQIEYDFKDVHFTLTIPTIKTYPNVINENWMFSYSSSATLQELIELTKEANEISKIKIPTDFLNQKDIIDKTQLFKIETVEDKINNSKLKGKELVDKVVEHINEYILTYAKKSQVEEKDEKGNVVEVWDTYEADTNHSRFMINGNPNYDYVWKVNEKFWRYNRHISPRELLAYFIAKGDKYEYRLLSYRILGVDCYLFKERLSEQLLIEGLLCVEDFAINIQTKSIDKPMTLSYKYEYATGNYYKKRRKLRRTPQHDLDNMAVYPMLESIELYYGENLGENIIQNQITFLESDLVRPKEMTWNSKHPSTQLLSNPLDPIFLKDDTQKIKDKSGYTSNLVLKAFYNYLGTADFTNKQVTRQELLFGYVLRLPESISLPLVFLQQFNCFKITILSKENPLNKKGLDVFAVFGLNDLKNEKPLFIGDDVISADSCKKFIKAKTNGGSIAVKRKTNKKTGRDMGTYAFSKKLKNLTEDSYDNLYEGGFISVEERDSMSITPENKKNIISEILIAFNSKQPKVIKEGDIQFNKFMNLKVDDLDALKMQQIWNETYNYIMYPKKEYYVAEYENILKLDNSKFPIFIEHSRYFKEETTKEFLLNNNQVDGIKFHVGNYNSSLLAHEVGFGKTTTAICSMSHNFLTGQANRTMICVPNPTYVNWIAESKGQMTPDGKKLRGLIPHINIVELKNARKDVFLQYDVKTFTQTGGIKKYVKSQIENIHNFNKVTSTVTKELNRVGSLYFTNYAPEGKKENYNSLVKFIDKTFDTILVDWRAESFFTEYFTDIRGVRDEYEKRFKQETEFLQQQEDSAVDRHNSNADLGTKERKDKIDKEREKYGKKKAKLFDKLVREFTSDILTSIKSKGQSIFDRIGVYQDCFLQKQTIVVSTHEAIPQLRIERNIASQVSEELKDSSKLENDLMKNPIGFEKLQIDSIIVDEVHNFNELFAYSKRQISKLVPYNRRGTDYIRNNYDFSYLSELDSLKFVKKSRGTNLSSVIKFNLTASSTSNKKATLYGICKTLQSKFKEKRALNVMLLSATPFVDDLFQMIGVFNMLRPFQMPISFFSNYLYQEWDWENDHKGETVLKVQTSDFKNHEARNNWIKLFSQFYTFDARINANRPNKLTYPFDCKNNANQYEDNCNTNVYLNFSEEQYKMYQNIGKFVEGSMGKDNIIKSIPNKVAVSKEPYVDPNDIETVRLMTDATSPDYNIDVAVDIFIANYWMEVINDSKHKFHNDIFNFYEILKDEIDERLSDDEDDEDDDSSLINEGEERVDDVNDASEINGNGGDDSGIRALQGQDYGKKLSLSPYMISAFNGKRNLFKEDGHINSELPPLYGMNTPENILKSAINFVETSPKIYFTVKCIECTINKHIENKEDVSGQVIYMAWGQNFWYGGVRYNGMELIKAYLMNLLNLNKKFIVEITDELSGAGTKTVKCGSVSNIGTDDEKEVKVNKYELEEVQILSGQNPDALKKKAISDSFNNGKIKILIGSSTIKEGINLQGQRTSTLVHGNSTVYILTAEYAPMSMMQLEGRIWRQGNPLENVRIVYPLIKNSIDNHIYSKLNEKIKKVKNMLEAGIYDFKETQFDKDIEGVSMALNTNVEEKVKIMWGKETKKIEEDSKRADAFRERLNSVKSKYSKGITSLGDLVLIYNAVSKGLEDYYVGKYIRQDYKALEKKIGEEIRDKKDELQDRMNKLYETDLAEWEKLKDENEKLNDANEKKNKANEKAIKDKKTKKIDKIDFTLDKPLKKDDKYKPDFSTIETEQIILESEAKEKAIEINQKKVLDKVFTNDEITYHKEITTSTPYSEISSAVSKLLSEISILQVRELDSDEMRRVKSQISVTGYYYVLEGKGEYIDYNFSKVIVDNSSTTPILRARLAKAIKDNNVQNDSGSVLLFKDTCKLFINGGSYETVFSDYQMLVVGSGKTIANIDDLINKYNTEIKDNNIKLTEKEIFSTKIRTKFLAEEEIIRKERESLKSMKEFVLVDVEKFCKSNKFIYFKGSLTEEQKDKMFKIKK